MTAALHEIVVGKDRIVFQLRRSSRKTLSMTVRPDASVVVTAPRRAKLDEIKQRVRRRGVWIRRQQMFFGGFLPQMPPRRYLSGETHRYLGRQYRLKVSVGAPEDVTMRGGYLHVRTRRTTQERIKRLVDRWFGERALAAFGRSFNARLKALNGTIGSTPCLRLRRMARRWGSCTTRGDIYLNPELIRAPRSCIDYVVTHEFCHLAHPNHGRAFYELLRRLMPDWETRKERLERMLAS